MRGEASLFRREALSRRDWTQGSITGNLWSLYWPMLISNIANAVGPLVDMIWVGKLGAASMAGVGVAGIAVLVINSLKTGIFTGTRALIARFMGGKDEQSANLVAQQAFVVGFIFSALIAGVGFFFAESILVLLGLEPDVVAKGAPYMRIQFIGVITMSAIMLGESIMNASGDSRTPMKINLSYRLFHVVLCPLLIFGPGIFPAMGVSGAALSNVIAQGAFGSISLWILFSGRTRLKVTLKNFRFDRSIMWRTLKIGIPASITQVERNFSDLVLVKLIIPFGTFSVAAHSVIQRIDQIVQTTSSGLGTSSGILAGQNLGAGKPERAVKGGWIAAGLATAFAFVFSIFIWFWAENIIRIFNSQPGLVSIASTFVRIQIAGYILWASVVSLSMCLNGVGDTMITMLTNLTSMWGVAIVLAYILSKYTSLGVYGVRWAMVFGIVVRAAIYSIYFKMGRWKRMKV